jgi:hypothetical protein
LGNYSEEINIRGLPTDAVLLSDHEAAEAAELDGRFEKAIQLSKIRSATVPGVPARLASGSHQMA